jgi:Flp pilus assembly protein TadD
MIRALRSADSRSTRTPERPVVRWGFGLALLVGCASPTASGPKPTAAPSAAHAPPSASPAVSKAEGAPTKIPSLGWQLLQEGRFDEARRVFEEELKKEPGSVVASRGLAESYRRAGDLEHAAVALRQTAAMDPSNAEVHVALSEVYGEMKRFQPAADESMEALQREVPPEVSAILKYNMACYEARLGNQRTALWWLRQALEAGFLEMDPKNFEHLQNDPDLESLRRTAAYKELFAP